MRWRFLLFGRSAHINAVWIGRFCDKRTHGNQAALANRQTITNGGVDAEPGAFFDVTMARENHMRGKKDVVLDHPMMANMVATPHDDIIANRGKWLERIILKNKAVFADSVATRCSFG